MPIFDPFRVGMFPAHVQQIRVDKRNPPLRSHAKWACALELTDPSEADRLLELMQLGHAFCLTQLPISASARPSNDAKSQSRIDGESLPTEMLRFGMVLGPDTHRLDQRHLPRLCDPERDAP